MTKCYSYNEEDFDDDFSSVMDQKVENFLEDNPQFVGEIELEIFEGEKINYTIGQFCPQIAENLTDAAYSAVDEASEDWIFNIESKRKDLQTLVENALEQWADQNNLQPSFWGVSNVLPTMIKVSIDENGYWA